MTGAYENYSTGFLFDGQTIINLSTLPEVTAAGWSFIRSATAINDRGQIVGTGVIGGQYHAYLLTPTAPRDATPPVITPIITGTQRLNGWYTSAVTLAWNVLDDESSITTQSGCDTTTLSSDTAGTLVTCSATSAGGTSSEAVTIKIDQTPPTITCGVTPSLLSPPNHKLVNVAATVNVADALSGSNGFTLASVTSNEPDAGLDKNDVPNDMQGWALGGEDLSGQLRAERSDAGSGRVYTLSYRAVDVAGNIGGCSTTVSVPHNQKK